MALKGSGVLELALLAMAALPAVCSGNAIELREQCRPGESTRALVELKAEGQYRPGPPPGVSGVEERKPLALRVESRLEFHERVLNIDSGGRIRRVVRWITQAGSAINGEVRANSSALRPEVALLVAENRPSGVAVFSPAGPLTRRELEVVQAVGDPLALADLLPRDDRQIAVGDHWKVGDDAAKGLSGYDALAANALEATLERVEPTTVRVQLKGEIRGAVLGGEGVITCEGWLSFNRTRHRIDQLVLKRHEVRKPGPVEEGLDIKSTLSVRRQDAPLPPELNDANLPRSHLDPDPQHELLLFVGPDGSYSLVHDRDWHIYWHDTKQTVLKRLDHGEVVAQCNLSAGPNAGRGRHQDPAKFREDIQRVLGSKLVEILEAGEIDGDPAGGYRYKVAVQGRAGNLDVLWYYFLIASPAGDQLLLTFTLPGAQSKTFGAQDLQLVGSFRWKSAAEPPQAAP
jgi:hypothetical protein